jgi:CRP/FNR family transcriptional regulator, cyclic AMP receptor protein
MHAFPDATFQVTRFLRMQRWFEALGSADQERLLRECTTQRAERGEVVLKAQQALCGWHAVLWGFVRLQSPAPRSDPASAFVAVTGGEWFGEGTALHGEPRRYEVVALRPTELLCVPAPLFQHLVATSLPFNRAVLDHINRRLRQAMAIIEAQRMGTLEQRLGLYLTRHFWHGLLRLQLNQTELGYLAGMSRQAVNRALHELASRALVTVERGRVVAVDQEGLERFLGMRDLATSSCANPMPSPRPPPAARRPPG